MIRNKLKYVTKYFRFKELTPSYLEEMRARRYEKAVPPEEDSMKSSSEAISHPMSIDQYGFGVLAEEVLQKKSDSKLISSKEFVNFEVIQEKPIHL